MPIIIILYAFLALVIMAIVLVISFILPGFKAAPFIATSHKKIQDITDLAQVIPGQKVAELGSGDGRLVIALARQGAQVDGFEINPVLVWWSRWKIKQSGLKNVRVYRHNFWQKNLAEYDVIVFFGIGTMMRRLEKKFSSELKIGTKIISNGFEIPGWSYEKKRGQIILYVIK